MIYRIRKRKQEQSNLTTYTLQKYIIRYPSDLVPFLGQWLNFATTTNNSRVKEWEKQYNVRL